MWSSRPDGDNHPGPDHRLVYEIARKEKRKLWSRGRGKNNVWFGLGMFGLIGWSVAIPTLLGIAVGIWIDQTWPSEFSWTLMLLAIGVTVGCLNAWAWVSRERRLILRKRPEEQGE